MSDFDRKIKEVFYDYIRGKISFPIEIPTYLYRGKLDLSTVIRDHRKLSTIKSKYKGIVFKKNVIKSRKISNQTIFKFAVIESEEILLSFLDFNSKFKKLSLFKNKLGLSYTSATNSNIELISKITDEEIIYLDEIFYFIKAKKSKLYTFRSLPHSGEGKYIEKNLIKIKTIIKLLKHKITDNFDDLFLKDSNLSVSITASDEFLTFSKIPLDEIIVNSLQFKEICKLGYELFIIENKESYKKYIPTADKYIKIWGEGRKILADTLIKSLINKSINYSGDMDLDGFDILAQLRKKGIEVKSFGMSFEDLKENINKASKNEVRILKKDLSDYLTLEEQRAYKIVFKNSLKIEQEKYL